jgi:hypothetical protein
MLMALKAVWRLLANVDRDRTWFPHADGKHMCRWNFQRQEYEFRPMSCEEKRERNRPRLLSARNV